MNYDTNQIYVGNLRMVRGDPQEITQITVEQYTGFPTGYQTFQKGYVPQSQNLKPGVNLVLNSTNTRLVQEMIQRGLSFNSLDGNLLPDNVPINLIGLEGPMMKPDLVCMK